MTYPLPYCSGLLTGRKAVGRCAGQRNAKLIQRGDPSWYDPSNKAGLIFNSPLRNSTRPRYSLAGTTGLSTEVVDPDGTRTHEATGLIVDALEDKARFTPFGMLSEVASANLARDSESISSGNWGSSRMDFDVNDAIAPDGAITADKAKETTEEGSHQITQTYDFDGSSQYTWSAHIRPDATRRYFKMNLPANRFVGSPEVIFDTSDWSIDTETDVDGAGIELTPSGYYRVWITATSDAATNNSAILRYLDDSKTLSYAGSPANYLHPWGFQMEIAPAPTSYIPTTTAAESRANEDLRWATSGNLSVGSGTILLAFTPNDVVATNRYVFSTLNFAGGAGGLVLQYNSSAKIQFQMYSETTKVADLEATSALVAGTTYVIAIAWAIGDARLYVNGADEKSATPASTVLAHNSDYYLGHDRNAQNGSNALHKHLLIYNYALSAFEIAKLMQDYYRWMPQLRTA